MWLEDHDFCPVTKQPLSKDVQLVPNMLLRNMILGWASENAPDLLVSAVGCSKCDGLRSRTACLH